MKKQITKPKQAKESNNNLFEQYTNSLSKEDKDEKEILSIRNKIILFNQPLVTHVINKYFSKNIRSKSTMQDLIQEGTFGLIEAINRFKPDKGFKFSTYAAWWIRQAVDQSLRETESPIVIPPHIVNIYNKYLTASQTKGISIEEALEQDYKQGLITKKMMLSTISAIGCNKTFVSINGTSLKNDSSSSNGKNQSNNDLTRSKKYSNNTAFKTNESDSQDAHIDNKNIIKSVKDALINIGPKKRNVILLRFGIVEKPIMLNSELKDSKGTNK